MSILIVSDSHGLTDTLSEIKNRHDITAMIHCGDSELGMDADEMQGFVKVGGNVDFDTRFPDEETVQIEGLTFYVAHGHLLKVNDGLLNLSYKAQEQQADIVCYGHTHKAGVEQMNHQLFINPGSIKQSRNKEKESYAILTQQANDIIRVDFYYTDGSFYETLSGSYDLNEIK